MIDTHLHILQSVNDGSETLQESLALAQLLMRQGIHVAVGTRHYNDQSLSFEFSSHNSSFGA
jgi:protein-tyrosine phosphatase